ncbi:hypothetical protein [Aurantibacillus circumpalustris]|uniref:hypothetical protein n=1 Tax=Aurantibacillus circumpalustris TaxID=3036359 RepID=UPI00295BD1FC|nr:hypothetical protein [Aurantibacillus circumpalustris]
MAEKKHYLAYFIFFLTIKALGFNGPIKFSDDFYAAQKYFYNQAKHKYSKLGPEKFYPEVPIKGSATSDELRRIEPLTDYFEARRKFLYEISQHPEQIYPEIFNFLIGHPALSINASNKTKLAAIEVYFSPFYFVFSSDKHYSFNPDLKQNPCPLIIYLKDEKKNTFSFSVYNTSKTSFDLITSETPNQGYLNVLTKKPVGLKGGGGSTIKFSVDTQKLKLDSTFKVFNFVMYDPTQPKVKLIVPVVVLPSKDFLNLPVQIYDFTFSYTTFFKHISLQKEKASWPEPCPSSDCSNKKIYSTRSAERLTSNYNFGEFCTVQYFLTTTSSPIYNLKNNQFKFSFNETGNITGEERNCYDAKAGIEVHCPNDAPNNGKEIYGTRKISFKLYLPPGKVHEMKIKLNYTDLPNQAFLNSELSWLQEKKILVVILDQNEKEVLKEFVNKNSVLLNTKSLVSGTYTVNIFPTTEDGKHVPSFNIQHLNHGDKSRFDFTLNGYFNINSTQIPSK